MTAPATSSGDSTPSTFCDAAYAAIYPDLAKEYGIPYQPNFMAPIAGKSGLLMDDGLHPTARGVEAMAEGVAEFLAPVIAALD